MSVVEELIGKAQLVQMMGNVEDVKREELAREGCSSVPEGGADPVWARVCVHRWYNSDNSKGRCVWERCHSTLLEGKN